MVAPTDPVAADITGFCILKHYLAQQNITDPLIDSATLWNQPQIVGGLAAGIGITSRDAYSYWSQGVDEIETIMQYLNQA